MLQNMDYESALSQYSKTLSKPDYLRIFLTKTVDYETVNRDLLKLGAKLPRFCSKNFKALVEFHDLAERYLNGETVRSIVEGSSFSKTFLQTALGWTGLLRNQSDAAVVTIEHKRLKTTSFGNNFKYNLNGQIINLRSSYELAFIQQIQLDPNVLNVEYESFKIKYEIYGESRNYVPDFKVTYKSGETEIVEVKNNRSLNRDSNIAKKEFATKFCEERGWKYRYFTENDIIWGSFPKFDDSNILYETKEEEEKVEDEPEIEEVKVVREPRLCDHFMTLIRTNQYNYRNHPRARFDFSYDDIKSYVLSNPPNSLTMADLCSHFNTSRNAIICRVSSDSGVGDFKLWETYYLKEISDTAHDRFKLKLKLKGIKDFDIPTLEDFESHLVSLNRICIFRDLTDYVHWARNKLLRYFYDVLEVDPHEVIEKVNSQFRLRSSSI